MGHPLSQTLFTSVYLNKLLWPVPRTVEEARFDREYPAGAADAAPMVNLVLRAYCLALVKACDFVLGRVTMEYYYEVGYGYGRRLAGVIHAEYVLGGRFRYPNVQSQSFHAIRCGQLSKVDQPSGFVGRRTRRQNRRQVERSHQIQTCLSPGIPCCVGAGHSNHRYPIHTEFCRLLAPVIYSGENRLARKTSARCL